jgi:hypothetical protein
MGLSALARRRPTKSRASREYDTMTQAGILKFGSRVVGFGALATVAITTSMLVLSPPATATPINDPAFVETLTNSCPANCASVALVV